MKAFSHHLPRLYPAVALLSLPSHSPRLLLSVAENIDCLVTDAFLPSPFSWYAFKRMPSGIFLIKRAFAFVQWFSSNRMFMRRKQFIPNSTMVCVEFAVSTCLPGLLWLLQRSPTSCRWACAALWHVPDISENMQGALCTMCLFVVSWNKSLIHPGCCLTLWVTCQDMIQLPEPQTWNKCVGNEYKWLLNSGRVLASLFRICWYFLSCFYQLTYEKIVFVRLFCFKQQFPRTYWLH